MWAAGGMVGQIAGRDAAGEQCRTGALRTAPSRSGAHISLHRRHCPYRPTTIANTCKNAPYRLSPHRLSGGLAAVRRTISTASLLSTLIMSGSGAGRVGHSTSVFTGPEAAACLVGDRTVDRAGWSRAVRRDSAWSDKAQFGPARTRVTPCALYVI